jgi:hypothetical protein
MIIEVKAHSHLFFCSEEITMSQKKDAMARESSWLSITSTYTTHRAQLSKKTTAS